MLIFFKKCCIIIPNHGSKYQCCLPQIQKAPYLFFCLDHKLSHPETGSIVHRLHQFFDQHCLHTNIWKGNSPSLCLGEHQRNSEFRALSVIHWYLVCIKKGTSTMQIIHKYHFLKLKKKSTVNYLRLSSQFEFILFSLYICSSTSAFVYLWRRIFSKKTAISHMPMGTSGYTNLQGLAAYIIPDSALSDVTLTACNQP